MPPASLRPHRAEWRLAALAGATAGLAASPFLNAQAALLFPVASAAAVALAWLRPAIEPRSGRGPLAVAAWLALVAGVGCAVGAVLGGERLEAIDAGALDAEAGQEATVSGFVTAVPRRSRGEVAVRVQTADGRLLLEAPEPVPELPVGAQVSARGTIADPEPWEAAYLRVHGIRKVLEADAISLTGRRREGVAGLTDRVRDRAERALERGMPDDEAALARGFVLGQDDRIDPATVDDFKRSGLAHLLAVSGQNVLLLGLLAIPLLAVLNVPLRARLVCILALIAIYVPVTGAGPSIQRAGVMGAAGIAAVLAGRPRARWYALGLAAFVTLAINPRASADVGWQLSFAAVAGILLWSAVLRDLLLSMRRGPRPAAPWTRALAEGAALTIAATAATAPLMAHHFETFSIAALPANLLALPAVAPVMWLGMLAAIAGQLPAIPVEPLNAVNSLLIAYIAQVAHWLASPDWAQAGARLPALGAVGVYGCLLGAGWCLSAAAGRRRTLGVRVRRLAPAAGALAVIAAVVLAWGAAGEARLAAPPPGLEISVLEVGQGDAILLEPAGAEPVLVDGGPPGAGLAEQLERDGVDHLGTIVLTHDSLDHSGGVEEILGSVPVERFAYATATPGTLSLVKGVGARARRLAAGSRIRSGSLRLDVLWPPPELVDGPARPRAGADPEEINRLSLVLLARWRQFTMLLTADAEAELVPVYPGPVDVLKVAHHGSEDAGLERLLAHAVPALAVISVGADNPYGHPAPSTLATLSEHGVPVARTDEVGPVQIDVTSSGWTLRPGVG
jgi:competence protein ComEC